VHSVPFGQIKAVTNQSRQFAYAFFSLQFTYDSDVDQSLALIFAGKPAPTGALLLRSNVELFL